MREREKERERNGRGERERKIQWKRKCDIIIKCIISII